MGGPRPWASLLLLLLLCGPHPAPATRCPRTCACYVPTELHCTFRSLRAVPHVLDPKIERVNLGFNHIRVLTHASFSGLARLQLLLLHGNEIADITEGALSDLGALQAWS
ncbi:matrix-remodeling-associated protein 5-like [Dipodomys merriami]|uniref:matrix-remodeling-associated protein 5-like n=1 Tax=Dipodomys merriami TaxID=94247 RepID=UPI003855BDAB